MKSSERRLHRPALQFVENEARYIFSPEKVWGSLGKGQPRRSITLPRGRVHRRLPRIAALEPGRTHEESRNRVEHLGRKRTHGS